MLALLLALLALLLAWLLALLAWLLALLALLLTLLALLLTLLTLLLTLLALLLTLLALLLALLTLLLTLLWALRLLFLPAAERRLEVGARIERGRVVAQRALVGIDRLVELVLVEQRVAAVVLGLAAHLRISRLLGSPKVGERVVERGLLGGRILDRLGLAQLGGAAVVGEGAFVDASAGAPVVGQRFIPLPRGVGAIAGLHFAVRRLKRLPSAEQEERGEGAGDACPRSPPRPSRARARHVQERGTPASRLQSARREGHAGRASG